MKPDTRKYHFSYVLRWHLVIGIPPPYLSRLVQSHNNNNLKILSEKVSKGEKKLFLNFQQRSCAKRGDNSET